jgi:hypothetical protein
MAVASLASGQSSPETVLSKKPASNQSLPVLESDEALHVTSSARAFSTILSKETYTRVTKTYILKALDQQAAHLAAGNTLGIMGAGGKASNVKVLTGASLHLSHLGVHI